MNSKPSIDQTSARVCVISLWVTVAGVWLLSKWFWPWAQAFSFQPWEASGLASANGGSVQGPLLLGPT